MPGVSANPKCLPRCFRGHLVPCYSVIHLRHDFPTPPSPVLASLVFTLGEDTCQEQMYCTLHQFNAVVFRVEKPTLRQYHVRRLLADSNDRQSACVNGVVTLLFNPALRNYQLNVAQPDKVLPVPHPAS